MKKLLLSILLLGFLALTARAQSVVLLFVDDSNPADVVITSTGNDPLVSNSTFTTYDGVSLLQFFTSNLTETDNGTVSGDLTPRGLPSLTSARITATKPTPRPKPSTPPRPPSPARFL
jgi:hypothetical protein